MKLIKQPDSLQPSWHLPTDSLQTIVISNQTSEIPGVAQLINISNNSGSSFMKPGIQLAKQL
jgi:hypothetical protein